MPINLQMPALSPTMEEGTLAKWLVKEGDEVASGDLLAEIETDKATMEFEAVDEGTIAKIVVAEGTDNVKVGEVIAIIAEEGEDVAEASKGGEGSAEKPKKEAPAPKGEEKPAKPSRDVTPKVTDPAPKGDAPASEGERIKVSPLARRLAEQKGVDLGALSGSGPGGRIIKADIDAAEGGTAPVKSQAAVPAPAPAATPASAASDFDIPHTSEKLSGMRKTIARRLTEAKQTIPHIYLTVDIQLDKLLKLRSELNATLEPRGVKLSVNDLLIKALAVSLMQVPKCNVSIDGDQLKTFARTDISVAVSIPGGLITPIITSADTKSLSTISTEMKDLAGRAKDGKLKMHEYQGGTASISNMGMFGIKNFDAVINPPQAMIMAIGAGQKRPHVIDDSLQIATVMSATGSFDHRAIDGADGAQLMQVFKELVENPLGMLA
ncbi:pyruvate dehydrogenase complex dihydrolipoamide acetyltransferase [Sphingorhabdus sp. EL138]|uniref:pyruvate dehydrogenase complex dihydrolipoamide acetyltransferase n=1 Tax=Sphingorhabdus sp. EL138 TaxID=2073156 RepID=UPI000D697C21|nr:pyruvate dehydrogenase complex dihydrolipoamide acetyltransferase [Sphingorhabdus sp. EL138]